ncbi:MAG: amino acid permease [Chitinispirillaceae bacterium]|nr:amino acid permease [Chitinispirillaceae bacterium]
MISSGLFVLPGMAFARTGPAVFLSYFIAGCVALTTVLSLSELMTAMPKAGGDYYYVSRSFGQLFGTVTGLLSWFALSLKSAFAVFGIAEIIHLTLHLNLTTVAVVLAVVFTLVNLFGVQEAVRFQIVLVAGLLGILVTFFVTGVSAVKVEHFSPFLSEGFNVMFSTAGFVFVSFGGVLTTASIAGEIKNPSRNIPLGLIGSVVVVTLSYSLITFVVVGIVPADMLRESLAPIALAGKMSSGNWLYAAIMVASFLAFITTANGGILTASRYPIALADDGMLPGVFNAVSKKKRTPYVSVIATGLLLAASVLLELDLLVKAASVVILLSNIFAHVSVVIMRESRISTYRPTYLAPLYPWLQLLGIAAFVLLIIDMGLQPVLFSLAFVSAGVLLYFIRRKKADPMSPALIHLLQRITNKALVTEGLQKELRTIVEDRDAITRDEFDRAVEQSCFVELDGAASLDDLWNAVSGNLCACFSLQISLEDIVELLRERENESSTAISDFVAIPHVIMGGEQQFHLVLVRSRQGIRFNDEHGAIHAVFILFGSKDMRNLHLRALAAIAQVVQHPSFSKRWMKGKGHQDLKDLLLLSKRHRQ